MGFVAQWEQGEIRRFSGSIARVRAAVVDAVFSWGRMRGLAGAQHIRVGGGGARCTVVPGQSVVQAFPPISTILDRVRGAEWREMLSARLGDRMGQPGTHGPRADAPRSPSCWINTSSTTRAPFACLPTGSARTPCLCRIRRGQMTASGFRTCAGGFKAAAKVANWDKALTWSENWFIANRELLEKVWAYLLWT